MIQDSANRVWLDTLQEIAWSHQLKTPLVINGALGEMIMTHEAMNHKLFMDMSYPQVTMIYRKLNPNFAKVEALMTIMGTNALRFAPIIERTLGKWSDDGLFIRHAYGPKFAEQMPYILKTFKKDKHSRRAVINLWRDAPGESKDTICALNFQFVIRDNKMNCIVNMRSSDIWLGLVNDLATYTYLAEYVRLAVSEQTDNLFDRGYLYCNAGSRHIYQDQLQKIEKVLQEPDTCGDGAMPFCENYDEFVAWLGEKMYDETVD
jgi:thymidylate synthase